MNLQLEGRSPGTKRFGIHWSSRGGDEIMDMLISIELYQWYYISIPLHNTVFFLIKSSFRKAFFKLGALKVSKRNGKLI